MTMMMLTQICRSSVPATLSITARGPVLPTISFKLGSLHMELVLYILASLASAAVWLGVVPGDIHMELALHVFSLLLTVQSRRVDMEPEAIRFGKTSWGPFGRTITPLMLTSMLMRLMLKVSMHTFDVIYRWIH